MKKEEKQKLNFIEFDQKNKKPCKDWEYDNGENS